MSCLFCRVVSGELPARKIYEDDAVVAFHDVNPQAPVHVLIVPRKHIATLYDVGAEDEPLIGRMHARATAIARELGVAERGYRTVFNCNSEAGQSVFHIHLHVLGGRPMAWPPG